MSKKLKLASLRDVFQLNFKEKADNLHNQHSIKLLKHFFIENIWRLNGIELLSNSSRCFAFFFGSSNLLRKFSLDNEKNFSSWKAKWILKLLLENGKCFDILQSFIFKSNFWVFLREFSIFLRWIDRDSCYFQSGSTSTQSIKTRGEILSIPRAEVKRFRFEIFPSFMIYFHPIKPSVFICFPRDIHSDPRRVSLSFKWS